MSAVDVWQKKRHSRAISKFGGHGKALHRRLQERVRHHAALHYANIGYEKPLHELDARRLRTRPGNEYVTTGENRPTGTGAVQQFQACLEMGLQRETMQLQRTTRFIRQWLPHEGYDYAAHCYYVRLALTFEKRKLAQITTWIA